MKSPFPGMDPYLEGSRWHSFHSRLIAELAIPLQAAVGEKYWVVIEEKIYWEETGGLTLTNVPDSMILREQTVPYSASAPSSVATYDVEIPRLSEVKDWYLEIRDLPAQNVITVVEILSPVNKRPGEGRDMYLSKRSRILASQTNLIEIDLLRTGGRLPMHGAPDEYDYGFLVHWANTDKSKLLVSELRDPLPDIPVPLAADDADAILPLQVAFDAAYDHGQYHRGVNYRLPADPPLRPGDQEWADRLLAEKGFR